MNKKITHFEKSDNWDNCTFYCITEDTRGTKWFNLIAETARADDGWHSYLVYQCTEYNDFHIKLEDLLEWDILWKIERELPFAEYTTVTLEPPEAFKKANEYLSYVEGGYERLKYTELSMDTPCGAYIY